MSTDIFSLRATDNISSWLDKWTRVFKRNIEDFDTEELAELEVRTKEWSLQLLGYVTQQYNQKSTRGKKQAVESFEKIIARIPGKIEETLAKNVEQVEVKDFFLGTLPHLFSLVPMSQTAARPIHKLRAQDGIVGGHANRVKAASELFAEISQNFLKNSRKISDEVAR